MKDFYGDWNYPTQVLFGPGRIKQLPDVCRSMGFTRPLLVTDPALAEFDFVKQAIAHNQQAGINIELFCEIKSNPVGKNIEAGVRHFHDIGCDGVIAFGGGSALDAGKAIALMVGQEHELWDFEDKDDNYQKVNVEGMARVVAIPTTAGTGSEVGRAAVILDESDHHKKIIFHPRMLPSLVICDPELTLGLPPAITAATGMDALAHNFEAYCAPGFHPMADAIALEAMRLIKENLTTAVAHGEDIAARANMMVASIMGATAFQKGLGAIHALSHPIGALTDAHHGLLNAIFIPYVMQFNKPAIESRMQHLARVLSLKDASFQAVLDWLLELREEIAIPHSFDESDIVLGDEDVIVEMAEQDPSAAGNPIPLDQRSLKTILKNAQKGRI